ncbi:hypothetical protein BCR34DRAFT_606303 [Clohesyomyces aquaticus]|uniref:Uncharacterized protein n=1 Tax=Clohesyomyces aquaticus TaxID=1231657 RepID=A0A1Y1YQJ3_9PLEO|nr:hypothetical protein BCR34DRAFT_606303 [Clohesyomyces aquaticus]
MDAVGACEVSLVPPKVHAKSPPRFSSYLPRLSLAKEPQRRYFDDSRYTVANFTPTNYYPPPPGGPGIPVPEVKKQTVIPSGPGTNNYPPPSSPNEFRTRPPEVKKQTVIPSVPMSVEEQTLVRRSRPDRANGPEKRALRSAPETLEARDLWLQRKEVGRKWSCFCF